VMQLGGALDGRNTAAERERIKPGTSQWRHNLKDGGAKYTFLPQSLTIIRFN